MLTQFYSVERVGAVGLSDGGGPFGFDITMALQVDYLVRAGRLRALVEAGCFLGDTTLYLGRMYPGLRIVACDLDARHARFAQLRTRHLPNVEVQHCDSRALLQQQQALGPAFYYLDAHWNADWPLTEELQLAGAGILCIDDFDIGHPRFAFDHYEGVVCGPDLLRPLAEEMGSYYVNNPGAHYPLPCLQVGRRAGRCFLERRLPRSVLRGHDYFVERPIPRDTEVASVALNKEVAC